MVEWCSETASTIITNGLVGGYFFFLGCLLLCSQIANSQSAKRLLGADTSVVDAKVLELHKKESSDDGPSYYCSYEFSADRADGVLCRVKVTDRCVPCESYHKMEKDCVMPVHYIPEDPAQCRLTCVAEVESSLCRSDTIMYLVLGVTMVLSGLFCIVGIACAWFPYGIPSYVSGMLLCYAIMWCFGVFGPSDATVTELPAPDAKKSTSSYGSLS